MRPRPKDRDAARAVILEIVRQDGGEFYSKTRLYKAFWQAHLAFARAGHGYLTAWPIVRMPNGPGIDSDADLFADLIRDGSLEIEEVEYGNGCTGFCFRLPPESERGDFGLPDGAAEAVTEALAWVRGLNAAEASRESHKSRAWNAVADGDEMEVYLDLVNPSELEESRIEMAEMFRENRDLLGV